MHTPFYTIRDDNNDSVDYLFSYTRIDTQENFDVYLARYESQSLLLQYDHEISHYQSIPIRMGLMANHQYLSQHAYVILQHWDIFEPIMRRHFYDESLYNSIDFNATRHHPIFAERLNPYLFDNQESPYNARHTFQQKFNIQNDILFIKVWNGLHSENQINLLNYFENPNMFETTAP